MIYYIKKETHIRKDAYTDMKKKALKVKIYLLKFSIQSIMFLSRILKSVKMHY